YLGLIGSAYSFTVYFTLIRRIGPARAAFSTLLVPIIAMALSTAVEGYLWSPVALVGGVLTLAGLFIALDARRSETGAARMVPAD
ncbi:MAG TPA: EamA family transporter, partial [Allosphingosinicella sp.]|nr:EamA family transporter [Allosphingosinicella sp.]